MQSHLKNHYGNRVDLSIFKDALFQIDHCSDCDFYWQVNVLSEPNMNLLYNQWIDLESSREKQAQKNREKKLNKVLILHNLLNALNLRGQNLKILDFGGGWSTFAQAAALFQYEAYLLETSEEKREFARCRGIHAIESLSATEDNFFDLVILNQVLEHVPEPRRLLSSILPKVKPGGGLYVAVPETNVREPVLAKGSFEPLEHINSFTPHSLGKLMRTVRLELTPFYSAHCGLSLNQVIHTVMKNAKTFFRSKVPGRLGKPALRGLPVHTFALGRR